MFSVGRACKCMQRLCVKWLISSALVWRLGGNVLPRREIHWCRKRWEHDFRSVQILWRCLWTEAPSHCLRPTRATFSPPQCARIKRIWPKKRNKWSKPHIHFHRGSKLKKKNIFETEKIQRQINFKTRLTIPK